MNINEIIERFSIRREWGWGPHGIYELLLALAEIVRAESLARGIEVEMLSRRVSEVERGKFSIDIGGRSGAVDAKRPELVAHSGDVTGGTDRIEVTAAGLTWDRIQKLERTHGTEADGGGHGARVAIVGPTAAHIVPEDRRMELSALLGSTDGAGLTWDRIVRDVAVLSSVAAKARAESGWANRAAMEEQTQEMMSAIALALGHDRPSEFDRAAFDRQVTAIRNVTLAHQSAMTAMRGGVTAERDLADERGRTIDRIRADLAKEISAHLETKAKLKEAEDKASKDAHMRTMAEHDREQAEQDAEAGAAAVAKMLRVREVLGAGPAEKTEEAAARVVQRVAKLSEERDIWEQSSKEFSKEHEAARAKILSALDATDDGTAIPELVERMISNFTGRTMALDDLREALNRVRLELHAATKGKP